MGGKYQWIRHDGDRQVIGENMDRLTYLFKQYDNILDWYKQAESKSTFLHAVNGILVGALNGLVFVGADKVKDINKDRKSVV